MQGYVRLPKDIFSLSVGGSALKVYSVLRALSFANHGGFVKISVLALCNHTSLSEESVKRALAELDRKGVIVRSKTYYGGRRRSNRYKVIWQGDISKGYILLDLSLLCRFGGDKLIVYLALCKHSNRHGFAYVSERALALELGLSRNTVRKYTAELEAENALVKYARFYEKHRLTKARRSFAYLLNAVEDMIIPHVETAPSEDNSALGYYYIPTHYFISVAALCSERIIPPRVPP